MKYSIALLLLIAGNAFSQIEKKVCFFGNSYTYVNDMPGLIADLAESDGNTLIKDQNTPGGYTLEGHSTNATTLTKITDNAWDFVVLQDQSQRPSFSWEQINDEVFPYGEILCDSIRAANECAIPLFFNTWGRRDGDAMWDSINTFTKMNQRLHNAYAYMADKNSGMLSPVGIGFEHIANDGDSPITHASLYAGDGSHPSTYGSYLAACIFYELIFAVSSEGNTFSPDAITELEAIYIQDVAHHVIAAVDSITTDYTNPEAEYTVSFDGTTATYTNLSVHAFSYLWEFGDGETSTEENPIHVYPDLADYEATLTAYYCDRESVTTDGTNYTTISAYDKIDFKVYPNPSLTGEVKLIYKGVNNLASVFSLDGKLVLETTVTNQKTITLPKGIYLVRINDLTKKLVVR